MEMTPELREACMKLAVATGHSFDYVADMIEHAIGFNAEDSHPLREAIDTFNRAGAEADRRRRRQVVTVPPTSRERPIDVSRVRPWTTTRAGA